MELAGSDLLPTASAIAGSQQSDGAARAVPQNEPSVRCVDEEEVVQIALKGRRQRRSAPAPAAVERVEHTRSEGIGLGSDAAHPYDIPIEKLRHVGIGESHRLLRPIDSAAVRHTKARAVDR